MSITNPEGSVFPVNDQVVLAAKDELPEPFARGWTLLVTVLGVPPTGVGTANANGRPKMDSSARVCMLREIYTETTENHKICTTMAQPKGIDNA